MPGCIRSRAILLLADACTHNLGAAEAAEEMRMNYNQVSWTHTPPPSLQDSRGQRQFSIRKLAVRRPSIFGSSQPDPSMVRRSSEPAVASRRASIFGSSQPDPSMVRRSSEPAN
eukprot:3913587-Prymnesium_polylepis.1